MRRLFYVAASHLPIVVGYLLAEYAPFSPVSAFILPAFVLIYPGLMVARLRERPYWAYWVTVVAVSTGLLLAGLVVARILGIHLHNSHLWLYLCGLTWVGWLIHPHQQERLYPALLASCAGLAIGRKALLIAGFALSYISAMWIVPPQQDQDMVIANPTYGYLQHGKPYGTETHFALIFSKPPLLHLQAGFTLLLMDRLEAAHFYWQSGRIVGLLDEVHWATRRFRQRDIESFELNPELVSATRMITIFYGTFLPLLVTDLTLALGASTGFALAGGFLFAAIPEVLIRAGYAGFTTPSNVLLAAAALLLVQFPLRRGPLFMLGAMVALLNQKTLFVPAAYVGATLLTVSRERILHLLRNPWLWGIATGTGLWWLYGATVDWQTFLRDHVYYDFRDRFLFHEVSLGVSGESWYPGVTGLWLEWARNLSLPLLLVGLAGVASGVRQRGSCRFLAFWAIVGWVLSSTTDWRQTKHLMLTIVPMAALGAVFVSRLKPSARRIVVALCLGAFVFNLHRIVMLWIDFDSLPPSTVW